MVLLDAVLAAPMPSGVEHGLAKIYWQLVKEVLAAPMPSGVEHNWVKRGIDRIIRSSRRSDAFGR